jgi:hypothetical protein
VTANGGTASTNTLAAVSTFCAAIDAASGLRAAILRLNLFCGNSDASLNAVRTPLYLSGSFGGATLGNATDTNFNFAQADYAETGASGGLLGNGTTKYLSTGFGTNLLSSLNSSHLSISGSSMETSIVGPGVVHIGTESGVGNGVFDIGILNYSSPANARAMRLFTGTNYPYQGVSASGRGNEPHLIATRTANNAATLYSSGSSLATDTSTRTPASTTQPIAVFCANTNGTPGVFSAMRGRCYSVGNGLTAAQALAFSNAVIAFNTTLGRA